MGSWTLRWNFNKPNFSPGEEALVSFWMENTSESPLYLSEVELKFDFGVYELQSISGMVLPRENKFLGNVQLSLPKNVVGRKTYTLKYRLYELLMTNGLIWGITYLKLNISLVYIQDHCIESLYQGVYQ